MPQLPDTTVLGLLVRIADGDSLSAAARALGMAQPNASRAIRQCERRYGIRLLERSTRGATLTADGQRLAAPARTALDALEQFTAVAERVHDAHESLLRVCASLTIGEYLAPAWLAALRRDQPHVTVRLAVRNSMDVLYELAQGSVDLGFVETPEVPTGFRSVAVATDRLIVVVSPTHPWAARSRISADELVRTPLVVRESGSGTRRTLDTAFGASVMAPPALELNSNSAVRVSVAAGAGPAVLSELTVAGALAAGDLVQVPVTDLTLTRQLHAVWRGPNPLTGPGADLVRIAGASGN